MSEFVGDSLISKRFPVNPESLQLLRLVQNGLTELQKEKPWVMGVSFFGSRTLGLETPSSDLDMFMFYDFHGKRIDIAHIREAEEYFRTLLKSHGVAVMRLKHGNDDSFAIDCSTMATHEQLRRFSDEISEYIYGHTPTRPPISFNTQMLLARFLLAVGDGVYQNRAYILDNTEYKIRQYGPRRFEALMNYLSDYERGIRGRPIPTIGYPKTIPEARAYFLTKPY